MKYTDPSYCRHYFFFFFFKHLVSLQLFVHQKFDLLCVWRNNNLTSKSGPQINSTTYSVHYLHYADDKPVCRPGVDSDRTTTTGP